MISGTPEAAQTAQPGSIAQITVQDSASTPAQQVIDVLCTQGIVDKKVVTFAVGWRGTAPDAVEVDPGQPMSAPAAPAPVNSNWAFSVWCTSQYDAEYGTGSSGTWNFSDPVTDNLTFYARWGDNRTEINALTATMDAPAVGNPIPSFITYTYTSGSPAELLDYDTYAWDVWNGTKWENASGTFESGKKYRIRTQMRIDSPASKTHRLAKKTDMSVTVNGTAWTMSSDVTNRIDYDNSENTYPMVWVISPDFPL